MISYGKQSISDSDIKSVVDVLRSDLITQGPIVKNFERALCQRVGASHSVVVNSATSALIVACKALGLTSGDILWTSPNSYVASANSAICCGASVDFVDIDKETHNISTEALTQKLIVAEREGKLPKVLMPVHFAGWPCDMKEIKILADKYGFYVLEDASHALGATYKGSNIGDCSYSDITVFSFHPVKIITTGEGGAAMTNSEALSHKMRLISNHGVTRDHRLMTTSSEGAWYYEQLEVGYNFRMSDIHAALGLNQLGRLDDFLSSRSRAAEYYYNMLAQLSLTLPVHEVNYPDAHRSSSHHLYPILVESSDIRRSVFDFLRSRDIGVNVHYLPIYMQPFYRHLGFEEGYCPVAEDYYKRAISLPLYPDLSTGQLDTVVSAVTDSLL